jgi:predicted amidophosphoribosyltransferase
MALGFLTLFFRCISCQMGLDPRTDQDSFPLCQTCLQSLIDCPPLCRHCGSPLCATQPTEKCLRPWIQHSEIQSYSARYLLNEAGYVVLRKWKIQRGTLFDRRLLTSHANLTQTWQTFGANAVVPIPQRYHRAWKMRGSRAEIIAHWVSQESQLPLLKILKPIQRQSFQKRQAELNLEHRLQNKIQFEPIRLQNPPKRVILVDDFMTTGHSLRQAATCLLSAGVEEVHAFCLGIRLPRFDVQSHSHLFKS